MILVRHFNELDRLLRGRIDVRPREPLSPGAAPRIDISAARLALLVVLLGFTYGLCMGSFAVVSGRAGTWKQMLACAVKVPSLFLLTLAITFPSLYVFGALVDSNLSVRTTLRLVVAALAVTLAVLASFGTIVAFFSFTTESHAFMVLLNVALFATSALFGMAFLVRTLVALTSLTPTTTTAPAPAEGVAEQVAPLARAGRVRKVFVAWVFLFALVGAQMSWILRPFIGGQAEFALFRARGSNFFAAVWGLLGKLLG
jgi:hypothetical protein